MKKPPSDLQDHLGFWLRNLSNHVSATFAQRIGKYDVSVANWVVLRVLFDHDAMTLTGIVRIVGVDQGALSRMVERLVVRGLLTRRSSPANRREIAISLTPEGRKLVPKLAREADENDRAFFDQLPRAERTAFETTIKTLLSLNHGGTLHVPLN